MLIQPVQPVHVVIKIGTSEYTCHLISLSEKSWN